MISRNFLFLIGILILVVLASTGCESEQKSTPSTVDSSIPYKRYDYLWSPKDRSQSIGYDIELFKESEAWDAAKAVYRQDTQEIRKLCVEHPEILKFQDQKLKFTLLQWAVYNRRYYSVKALLEMGANPNVEDITGSIPLIEASTIDETSEYEKLILKFGGDVNKIIRSKQISNNTPLAAAVTTTLQNVKILVNAGANVHDTESNHFYNACCCGYIDVVEYLITNCQCDFKRPVMINIHGKPIYAYAEIAERNFPQGTHEHATQQRLLSYLKEHGSDTSTDMR
jgi:hypothetical protein